MKSITDNKHSHKNITWGVYRRFNIEGANVLVHDIIAITPTRRGAREMKKKLSASPRGQPPKYLRNIGATSEYRIVRMTPQR